MPAFIFSVRIKQGNASLPLERGGGWIGKATFKPELKKQFVNAKISDILSNFPAHLLENTHTSDFDGY
jgi:hypothetical protein